MNVLRNLKPESSDTREETVQGLLHCFTERLACSRGLSPCYDHDIIFLTPSVKVQLCLLSLSSNTQICNPPALLFFFFLNFSFRFFFFFVFFFRFFFFVFFVFF